MGEEGAWGLLCGIRERFFYTLMRVLPHSNSISSMTSMILLFMSLDPTIKGSNLSNSKIIDVVDEIEVECGRALIDVRCLNISAAGMSSFMWVHV